ncbi:MAG: hypothetical protein GC179_16870 [Anaerolineaceae bacterium]|nr:hypothetical protein [Anaerolineaceae bacterium]
MNCRDVKRCLAAYIDGEIKGYEQTLIEQHLAECKACHNDLVQMKITRQRVQKEIKKWAASAVPSASAWDRLIAKIAAEKETLAQPHSISNNPLRPGTASVRRLSLTALIMILIVFAVVLSIKNKSTVSAREILDRAQAAQTVEPIQGILHIQTETYRDLALIRNDRAANQVHLLIESYYDYQDGRHRQTVVDFETGNVAEASAYDGVTTYNAWQNDDSLGKFVVYRTKRVATVREEGGSLALDLLNDNRQAFERMQNDPNTELVSEQTWTTGDGRKVYVLRSKLRKDPMSADVYSVLSFDAQTYRIVENRLTVEQDDHPFILGYSRQLIYEILPTDVQVIWNLSDLKRSLR